MSPPLTLPVPALSVQHLSVAYHDQPVLRDVSWTSPASGLVAIVGPNGAGKSTLLKTALGLVPRLSGEVRVFGLPLAQARRRGNLYLRWGVLGAGIELDGEQRKWHLAGAREWYDQQPRVLPAPKAAP